MKYILGFSLLVFSYSLAVGQSDLITLKPPKPAVVADDPDAWKLITMSDDLKDGWAWQYKTFHKTRSGDVEAWIKSVPFDTAAFRKDLKLKTARYVMEFYTFHCRDRRFSAESVMIYGNNDKLLIDGGGAGRRFREPLVPDSVNAGLYDFFCP